MRGQLIQEFPARKQIVCRCKKSPSSFCPNWISLSHTNTFSNGAPIGTLHDPKCGPCLSNL